MKLKLGVPAAALPVVADPADVVVVAAALLLLHPMD